MYKLILFITLLACAQNTMGQDSKSVNISDAELDSIGLNHLPELDTLLSLALNNSPLLKMYEAEVIRGEAEIKLRKREWSYRVFTDAGTTYASNYSVLTVAGDGGGFESVSLGNGNVVRGGVTVRLSLFDIIGRSQLINKAEAEKQMSQAQLNLAKQELTADLTELHTQLKYSRNLVEVGIETIETLNAQLQMAEKEFRQGEIHITELARITEIRSKSKMALATARANYENQYKQLEIAIGTNLQSIVE